MSIPFKKYGYELNPITDEYKTPQIFLVNKRLKKMGELYPIENLKITVNEINQADEISFTYYRKVDSVETPLFSQLDDLSVILVEDYGYFEISVDKNENSSIIKNISGISLGHAELSQILTTVEINTDDDMNRTDYDENYPTVFYRNPDTVLDTVTKKKYVESSLLHRILSCAPHYKIGSVSDSLKQIQRIFSWSDTDIISIFNDISQEINCVFDIEVYVADNGKPCRVVNVYDLQYCSRCYDELDDSQKTSSNTYKYRTIVNGVCKNCGLSDRIHDIGVDTNIFISTENLSDDISIRGDKDSIKNCFKVVGGDDMITNTLKGLNMSASDKIMMISDKQKKEMSKELITQLNQYDKEYQENIGEYEKLLETEYNIIDIKHYLRSSKMPPLEKEITTTDMALYMVIQKITEFYHNKFYISSYENYGYVSARTSIQNMFTTFMPEGYSFVIDYNNMTEKTKSYNPSIEYHWYGTIRIYSTGNRDENYTLHLQQDKPSYITVDDNDIFQFSNPAMQKIIDDFSIIFYFADQSQLEYKNYIQQHTKYILSQVDLTYENEKERPWNLYSYNRLSSFYNGYQSCIETLEEMKRSEISTSETGKILDKIITSYKSIQKDIQNQMNVLLDQLFAICSYYGEYDSEFLDADGKISYTLQYYKDLATIYNHIINSSYTGGYQNETYKVNEFIGTKPFQCKKCGSSNVSESTNGNICNNPGCNSSGNNIYTYLDIMKNIIDSYNNHKNDTVTGMRKTYQKKFDMGNYLDDELYAELRSFIREDVYKNENYTSDGLSNTQIIEMAKELRAKAELELSKACMSQYTVDVPLSSIVGQKSFTYHGVLVNDDYSDFKINNFVRVRIDDEIYKMRIATIGLTFPIADKIDVTFTNVTNNKTGSTSDIKDIISKAENMATSYSCIASQAEKGNNANDKFNSLLDEGLDAALISVNGGRDHDIVIDEHGILLRRKDPETGIYSPLQMKLIDRNIVMTTDNWESAELAIGLGMYNGNPVYGIWAQLLCGDLTITKELHVHNDNGSVIIDENGITLDGGAITWLNPINKDNAISPNAVTGLNDFKKSVNGSLGVTNITSDSVISPKIGGGYLYIANNNYSVEIDPNNYRNTNDDYLFCIRDRNKISDNIIMGVDQSGSGYFKGFINATSGNIGDWTISEGNIVSSDKSLILECHNDKGEKMGAITSTNSENEQVSIAGGYIYISGNKGNVSMNSDGIRTNVLRTFNNDNIIYIGDSATEINLHGYIMSNITIGKDINSNENFFILRNTGFDYHYGNNIAKHYMSDSYVGFCEDGLGNMTYKGYEVLNKNTNITELQKTCTSSGNIRSGIDMDGYNFATVGYVQNNFQRSSSSDFRLKKEILPINNIKSMYLNFKPKQYSFKDGCAENDKVHYGLLAQQVVHVLEKNNIDWENSDLVEEYETRSYMDEGKYAGKIAYRINYENLHALHIAFAQEMHKEIETLKEEIELLKKKKDGE